jgi:hypothetical protein
MKKRIRFIFEMNCSIVAVLFAARAVLPSRTAQRLAR